MKDGINDIFDEKLSFCNDKKTTNFVMQTAIVIMRNFAKFPISCSHKANTTFNTQTFKLNDLFFVSFLHRDEHKEQRVQFFELKFIEEVKPVNVLMKMVFLLYKIDLEPEENSRKSSIRFRIGSRSRINLK